MTSQQGPWLCRILSYDDHRIAIPIDSAGRALIRDDPTLFCRCWFPVAAVVRSYGGFIFFGSHDIGGASVIANLVRGRGISDVPVARSWRICRLRRTARNRHLPGGEEPCGHDVTTGQQATVKTRGMPTLRRGRGARFRTAESLSLEGRFGLRQE